MAPRISEEVIITAVVRYAGGESSISVAKTCDISASSVLAEARRLGVPIRKRGPGSRAWSRQPIGWIIGDMSVSPLTIHTTVTGAVSAYLEASRLKPNPMITAIS